MSKPDKQLLIEKAAKVVAKQAYDQRVNRAEAFDYVISRLADPLHRVVLRQHRQFVMNLAVVALA